MSIHIPLDALKDHPEVKKNIIKDLTVRRIDARYEKMKKIGRIMPGYTPNPNDNIECFNVVDGTLHLPFYYGKKIFDIESNEKKYETLNPNIECTVNLRENQIPIIEHCKKELDDKLTTTLGLPPGFGKTFTGMYLSFYLGFKVIIIVPRVPLIKQWFATAYNSFKDADIWPAFLTSAEKTDFDKSFSFFDSKSYISLPERIPDVTICLDPRIKKIPDLWKKRIGTLILDEAHMLPTEGKINSLLSLRPLRIIMETATMERDDGLHKICHHIAGEHGYYSVAKDKYDFKIIDLPQIRGREVIGPRGIDYNQLCDSLSTNKEYNNIIIQIVIDNPNSKFMVLTKRVSHGNDLLKMFQEKGITVDSLMGTKKSYTNSRVLIGTYTKIGTGFDEKSTAGDFEGPTSDSMIMCHSVANTQNFEQYRGRVMRHDTPTVYWLNTNNKVIRNQLTTIKKHVLSTNGVITTIKKYST